MFFIWENIVVFLFWYIVVSLVCKYYVFVKVLVYFINDFSVIIYVLIFVCIN